jgi:hypothetical protein
MEVKFMIQANIENIVILEVVKKEELSKFKRDLQEAFAVAVVETFDTNLDELIPSDKDIEKSFNAPGAIIYHILSNGKRVGGAVVVIDEATQYNTLDLLFISVSEHSSGIGYKAWKAIEDKHSETKVWETHTPYFEKRNIHFYVNKCGFQIVEYFNKHKPDPHKPHLEELSGGEDFFRFQKVMKKDLLV